MNISVSTYINETYGIKINPGAKGECPKCHHIKTLSIKRDDKIGTCFHPKCDFQVLSWQLEEDHKFGLYKVLNKIFIDFHKELLENNEAAYRYLSDSRKFHPKVIQDAMLGSVPSQYDFESSFKELIDAAKEAYSDAQSKLINSNNKKEKTTLDNKIKAIEAVLEQIEMCKTNLVRMLEQNKKWICFFYTDSNYRITGIRLREPNTRNFAYCKLSNKNKGVLGLNLFSNGSPSNEEKENLFIQVEGDANLLKLQSLVLEVSEAKGIGLDEVSYFDSIAIGSSSDPDFQTIKKINPKPIVAYDADAAGFSVVAKARETMHVSAFRVPEPYNDVDEYINSFDNSIDALGSIMKLIEKREFYYKYFRIVEDQITDIRRGNIKEFEINKHVAEVILQDMNERGKFYNDGNYSYYFSEENKVLMPLQMDSKETILYMDNYGLNPTEKIYKYVMEALRSEALRNGTNTNVYRNSYYDKKNFTVYVNNFANKVYKISPEAVEEVDNGYDGVLFISDPRFEPFELLEPDHSKQWFNEIIVSKINLDEADKFTVDERLELFEYWFYSMFFESIMRTKPVVTFVGVKGSGKSFTMKKVGLLLTGKNFDVTPISNDPKDFDAAVTNSDYVVLDNADTRTEWLEDRIATVSTGGTIKRRKLYTTNELVEIPSRCFLGITSRTPKFGRDDIADRLLIFKVKRISPYIAENILIEEVMNNRSIIITEIIYKLQQIVRILKQCKDEKYLGQLRMADFADFALKVSRIKDEEEKQKDIFYNSDGRMENIFKKLRDEQSMFTLNTEPIVDLLTTWVNQNRNSEKYVTNKELCEELTKIAENLGIKFGYKGNHRGFAYKMSNIRVNLDTLFNIESKSEGGRVVTYRYSLKDSKDTINDNTINRKLF